MSTRYTSIIALSIGVLSATPTLGRAQHAGQHPGHAPAMETVRRDTIGAAAGHRGHTRPAADAGKTHETEHTMWMRSLGKGWNLSGTAQVFPIVTSGAPFDDDSPLHDTEAYATQPAVMLNLESPRQAVVLRTTLNFEAWTQQDGEYTFGGWGEGFLDKRHPHTLVHEAMLSVNFWDAPGGSLSISAGKGFAPYGTEDPMSRPVAKFPTNHHLSQILERWTVNGAYLHGSGLSLEAGLFGGAEPEDPYDLGNIESFGDSWSARLTQRFGGTGAQAPWEVSVSYGHVEEEHHETRDATELYNAAIRHAGSYGFGRVYALVEASKSEPEAGKGYLALLGETRVELGRHRPYYRAEFSTRPEYARQGQPGSDDFYRYDHDSHAVGASRWRIHTLGYETEARTRNLITRPFVEAQYNRVEHERGEFDPATSFGDDRFWSVSAGFKLFLGGDSMRMGSYGVLDPMTGAMRAPAHGGGAGQDH